MNLKEVNLKLVHLGKKKQTKNSSTIIGIKLSSLFDNRGFLFGKDYSTDLRFYTKSERQLFGDRCSFLPPGPHL